MKKNRWKVSLYVAGIILATKLIHGDYTKALKWKDDILQTLPYSARKEATWLVEEV